MKKEISSLEKALALFVEATRLRVLYGTILTTPAVEIKRKKLKQIKKELEMLKAKVADYHSSEKFLYLLSEASRILMMPAVEIKRKELEQIKKNYKNWTQNRTQQRITFP